MVAVEHDPRAPREAAQHAAIRHERNPPRGGEGARGTLAAFRKWYGSKGEGGPLSGETIFV